MWGGNQKLNGNQDPRDTVFCSAFLVCSVDLHASLYTSCFSLKHGSSAAFKYNHNWRWIDFLWIPLFSFLESEGLPWVRKASSSSVRGKVLQLPRSTFVGLGGKEDTTSQMKGVGVSWERHWMVSSIYNQAWLALMRAYV